MERNCRPILPKMAKKRLNFITTKKTISIKIMYAYKTAAST